MSDSKISNSLTALAIPTQNSNFSQSQKIAFVTIVFGYCLVWVISFNSFKNNDFNYASCINISAMLLGMQGFFYTINRMSKDLITKNWFSVGLETIFCLAQVIILTFATTQLNVISDPFIPSLYLVYVNIIFFAQVYLNKMINLLPVCIFGVIGTSIITAILKLIITYTPENYTRLLIWVGCSYSLLIFSVMSFFVVLKTIVEKYPPNSPAEE